MDYLSELFLTEYFSYEVLLKDFGVDLGEIFLALGKVFLLPEDKLRDLYVRSTEEAVCEIRTEKELWRRQRIREYLALRGEAFAAEDEEIILIKGKAITGLTESGCLTETEQTRAAVAERLLDVAAKGKIKAMCMAGFLLAEGIFYPRDLEKGLRLLRQAASWNNPEGLLLALRYDPEKRENNLSRLHFVLKNLSHEELMPEVERVYGACADEPPEEAEILEKLFRRQVLKREDYLSSYARTLSSPALHNKDKERVLFAGGWELLSNVSELPLKLCQSVGQETCDLSEISVLSPPRETECAAILQGLRNADLRKNSVYRPLCLCSDSAFMLKLYADEIAKSVRAHVARIDVASLDRDDLESSKNHVFVRNCDEDQDNIFFLFFQGEIREERLEEVMPFLRSENRRQFYLNHPSVCLDLSSVLPVCFCSEAYEAQLKEYCDIVPICDAMAGEKPELVKRILREKETTYGIPEIRLDSRVKPRLFYYSIGEMEARLDEAIRKNRRAGEPLILTKENTRLEATQSKRQYGFGGFEHENG